MSATCYFASGLNADLSGSTYIPCNTTAVAEGGHSACCAPGDMCFTNGLCKASSDDQYNWNWRVGCTDPTFTDAACPSYCQGIDSDNAAHLVFQCSDNENWCCSTGNPDNFRRAYNFTCCTDDDLVLDLGPAVYYVQASVSISISTLESSSTATTGTTTKISTTQTTSDVKYSSSSTIDAATFATPTTSANSSYTNSTKSSTSKSSSTALGAGLGVGIPASLALIGLIAFLFYRLGLRQNRRAAAQHQEADSKEISNLPGPVHSDHFESAQYNETLLSRPKIDYPGHGVEMAHLRSPVELEGRRMYEAPS